MSSFSPRITGFSTSYPIERRLAALAAKAALRFASPVIGPDIYTNIYFFSLENGAEPERAEFVYRQVPYHISYNKHIA
nr:MAG TPA: hypothetical protein [Caudoviricetes sp.]